MTCDSFSRLQHGLRKYTMNIICITLLIVFVTREKKANAATECPEGKFGYNCQLECHCVNNTGCDQASGACFEGCAQPWSGDACQNENIALGKPSTQKEGNDSVDVSLGVDGDFLTCSKTTSGSPGWYMVDLKNVTSVLRFRIVTDNTTSLYDWNIVIGEKPSVSYMRTCTVLKVYTRFATVLCDTAHSPERSARYVVLLNKQGPLVVCELQVILCGKYRYGEICEKSCQCRDPKEQCHTMTGMCSSGCRPGRTGIDCQKFCEMSYGTDCLFECGQCENKTACDPVSGECHQGCTPGWRGSKCDIMCPNGLYGKNCSRMCGHCRNGQVCDPWKGRCTMGCAAGWMGEHCDLACVAGKYGEDCQFSCGHCAAGTVCNIVTGICESGCDSGWRGRFCSLSCLLGTYGENCNRYCPHCKDHTCDVISGECLNRCVEGYMGAKCETQCPTGFYGENCMYPCGHCLNGELCRYTDGNCVNGCQPGFNGSRCHKECPNGFYGIGCKPCGFCRSRHPCDKFTGTCGGKCINGYQGDLCQDVVEFKEKSSRFLGSVLGLGMTAVMVPTVFVLVCLCIKWRAEDTYPYRNMWLPENE